jgi:hypothetical protein
MAYLLDMLPRCSEMRRSQPGELLLDRLQTSRLQLMSEAATDRPLISRRFMSSVASALTMSRWRASIISKRM